MPTSVHVPETLRRKTRERARGHCEYCLLSDEDAFFPFEADHIVAQKHGGLTVLDNLAWTCMLCNRFKGTDIASLDPLSGRLVRFFNPRTQRWQRHFRLNGAYIESLTACGRVTERILQLNAAERVQERQTLIALGRYPNA